MTENDWAFIFVVAIFAIPLIIVIRSWCKRRKAATATALRCFAMSENPAVKASRRVH